MLVWGRSSDWEPMVAFICNKPAMHRGVDRWISDDTMMECLDDKHDILDYCRQVYPSHNITNVVESSYLLNIDGWPSYNKTTFHTHRVRPFRCIENSFQSDALLVPQHCKFDHKHDAEMCREFSHWEVVARDACNKDSMRCESFGLLLNCGLGKFSGVEYVCCPTKHDDDLPEPVVHPTPAPESGDEDDSDEEDEDDSDEDYSYEDDDDSWESSEESESEEDTETYNVYELYLKGAKMPANLINEHQQFVAARQFMHKLQEAKNTQLMKEWTAARDHVNEVRKTDPRTAEKLSKDITERFQRLYNAYEQEDVAEKQQIVALHQQRVQSSLNQRKRVAMDKFLRALEKSDVMRVGKALREYIKAEEKDTMHTVNHYSHVKSTDVAEALRIHPHVIQHLKLCQQRLEQALAELQRFPDIERNVRPEIETFMKRYDEMAVRIRNVVLPEPEASSQETDSDSASNSDEESVVEQPAQPQTLDEVVHSMSTEGELDSYVDSFEDSIEDSSEEERENEHDIASHARPFAHQQHDGINVEQDLKGARSASTARLGTTFGIAIGSVAVFVVLVVAVVMLRRRSAAPTTLSGGYVEVDPAASPEERHVANMQMNGYENPTYRYFEVQNNK